MGEACAELKALRLQVQGLQALVASLAAGGAQDQGQVGALTVIWLMRSASQVFLMQVGFAFVEAGSCRAKNVLSILVKNQLDLLIGAIMWYLCGYGFAFGDAAPTRGLLGTSHFLSGAIFEGDRVSEDAAKFHFQCMFCAVAATIVSGGVAERAQPKGYMIFSTVMSGFVYPTIACWCWNEGGWLYLRGYTDFAGAGVVHLTGGIGALVGAVAVGPRVGRFKLADQNEFSPHNVPYIVFGTMLLFYGWYGCNTGNVDFVDGERSGQVAGLVSVNTTMGAVAGGLVASGIRWWQTGRWDVPCTCNGIMVGLVAITAACATVTPPKALLMGGIAAVLHAAFCALMERLRVDDPVSAFAVHGVGGTWGVLATALFDRRRDVLGDPTPGVSFAAQLEGVLSIWGFSGALCCATFFVVVKAGFGKASSLSQRRGLDHAYETGAYSTRYRAFISHAKSTHGATARWLQLELGKLAGNKNRIFLDSDDLVDLTHLLSTLRDEVDVLVVLATPDIWWRPWCAGEIAVASMSGIPTVLVMMEEERGVSLELDFKAIASRVRFEISPRQMEILTPFGIDLGDVQRAYLRLADAVQVPFSVSSAADVAGTVKEIAGQAEIVKRPNLGHPSWRLSAGSPPAASTMQVQCGPARFHKNKSTYLLLCDTSDMEAVAAVHICKAALYEVIAEQRDLVDIICCSEFPEEQVLEFVEAGATIILVLSRGVLSCGLVQRACVIRAALLWPGGASLCSVVCRSRTEPERLPNPLHRSLQALAPQTSDGLAVVLNPDRLGFEFPNQEFYDALLRDHPHLSDDQGWGECTWFPTKDEAASALLRFYKRLFNQIALPLSTHGSWRTIIHQLFWVFERASKLNHQRSIPHAKLVGSSASTSMRRVISEPIREPR